MRPALLLALALATLVAVPGVVADGHDEGSPDGPVDYYICDDHVGTREPWRTFCEDHHELRDLIQPA